MGIKCCSYSYILKSKIERVLFLDNNLKKYNKIFEYIKKIRCIYSDKLIELKCFSSMLQKNDVLVENYIIYDILELMESNLQVIPCIENDIGKRLSHGEELKNNIALLSSIYTTQDLIDYLFIIFKISNENIAKMRGKIREVRNETVGHPICYGVGNNQNILTSTIVWNNIYGISSYDTISYLYREDGKLDGQKKKEYDIRNIISEHFDFVLYSLEMVLRKIVEILERSMKNIWFPLINACFQEKYETIINIGFKANNVFLSDYFRKQDTMILMSDLFFCIIDNVELKEYKLKLYGVIFSILNLVYEENFGILYDLKALNNILCRESEVVKKLEEQKNNNIAFYNELNIIFNEKKGIKDMTVVKEFLPDNFAEIVMHCKDRDKNDCNSLVYNYYYSKIIEHKYYDDFRPLKKIYSFDTTILGYFEKLEKYWFVGEDYLGGNEKGYCEYHINYFYLDWLLHYIENTVKDIESMFKKLQKIDVSLI